MSNNTKHNQLMPSKKQTLKETKKGSGNNWLLLGFGVAATGALSYFGFQYWKKHKKSNEDNSSNTDTNDTKDETPPAYVPPKHKAYTPPETLIKDAFPLSKGSKGANVKAFQEALITKYGKTILPKYGADSDFGTEMLTALKKVGLPETISETTFNLIVKGSSPDHQSVARDLYNAALGKNFNKAIELLKTLRNADDYKMVSDTFVNYRLGGVRQTLVNGMLNSFNDSKQKDAIRLAFSTMGLKYDGNKWSLSGIDNDTQIITLQNTRIWKNSQQFVSVPKNMVLGKFITQRGAYTLFQNENAYYLVETQHVKDYH